MINILASNNEGYWVFGIAAVFIIIGVVVFILRKKIPGLVEYEEQDEEEIAQENLSLILVDFEEYKEEKKEDEN